MSTVCLRMALIVFAMTIAAPFNASAQMSTRPGPVIGGQFSRYVYEEPDFPSMRLAGSKVGVTGAYTFVREPWFAKGDLRYSFSKLQYDSSRSGSQSAVPDTSVEVRIVAGRDFFLGSGTSLSPYAGLGYRNLFNDLRGHTSVNTVGYRRYSEYAYLPVGVTSRMSMSREWVFVPTVEFDIFLHGRQESKMTDTNHGLSNALNVQHAGYGARASAMFEKGSWAFGPWIQAWGVRQTNAVPIGRRTILWEPDNRTWEAGLEVRYHF